MEKIRLFKVILILALTFSLCVGMNSVYANEPEGAKGAVGAPADFDLSTINTIAKDKDGNCYGVKTYGNSFDTTTSKPFYVITEEQYNTVAKDCFMVFKRQDGKPFEIPSAEICTNGIDSPQPRGDKAGPIFTEVQFRHHMAYRLGFIVNNDPTRLNSQKDLTWSIKLKKDWVIEPCPEFGSNSTPDYAYIFFNVVLDGDGHKIYRNDNNEKGIFFFGYGIEGNSGIPVKTATLKNITIDGSDKYFGIAVTSKGILSLENVKIQNGFADSNHLQYGGAIKLRDGAKLTMDASTIIKDCKAIAGGAIQLSGNNTININGSTFLNNAAKIGGAICSLKNNNEINIRNTKFENNRTEEISQYYKMQGGAIYSNSKLNIENTDFKNNTANLNGGAIASFGDITINGGNFSENKSVKNGGAIYSNAQNSNISGAKFKGNVSNSQGGAIYANSKLSIIRANFEKNTSKFGGAIISYEDFSLKDSDFNKNEASFDGGAIYQFSNSKLDIEESNFLENICNRYGGSVYINKDIKAKIEKTAFKKNQAAYGAGISTTPNDNSEHSILTIDNSIFDDNYALLGGGLFTAFPTEIKSSTFTKNEAQVHEQDDQGNPHHSGVGGAVYVIHNQANIESCKFIKNNAYGSGGAIGINGVNRDRNDPKKITSLKDKVKVNIKGGTVFENNYVLLGQGGAIYTIPYSYDLEGQQYPNDFKDNAYANLATAKNTVFKGNWALSGFFNPPKNYADFTNLKFANNSFTDKLKDKDLSKSLINNYDVNYKNTNATAYFDPNGGKFKDKNIPNPKAIKEVTETKDTEIKILEAPKREGYKFSGWKATRYIPTEQSNKIPEEVLAKLKDGKIYKPGDKFILDSDYVFVAQWEKTETTTPSNPSTETKIHVKFDANGGEWDNDEKIRIVDANKGDVIKILEAPKRDGYTFKYWKGSKYYPGDSYTVVGPHTFIAQWEKTEQSVSKPETNKPAEIKKSPKTGDNIGLIIINGIASLIGIIALVVLSKNKTCK